MEIIHRFVIAKDLKGKCNMIKLNDFIVEELGVEFPSYFQGYGLWGKSDYQFCTYGIGDTEEEALDDCMEMMAQTCNFDFNDEIEKRIRDKYGIADCKTTASEYLGVKEDKGFDDYSEYPYYHIGIKWNEKEE